MCVTMRAKVENVVQSTQSEVLRPRRASPNHTQSRGDMPRELGIDGSGGG